MTLGILLPTLLLSGLFFLHARQKRQDTLDAFVSKARALCLTVEAARHEGECKWADGVFAQEQMREWVQARQLHKVLSAVPVVTAWRSAMRNAEEGDYVFKVPKFHPRNPANEPDAVEADVLEALSDSGLNERFVIDRDLNAVRYFRPVRLTETCLACHGDPAESQALWGNDDGLDPTGAHMEGWDVGEMHGAFEVIQSLDEADAALRASLVKAGIIAMAGLMLTGASFAWIIGKSVNARLRRVTESLTGGARQTSEASGQIARSSQHLAEASTEQAAAIQETGNSLLSMSKSTHANADNAGRARALAEKTNHSAHRGRDAMRRMSMAIDEIKASSDHSAKIVQTINQIAFQTNLLALNASVEAARAGAAGKGFAVVADEVRQLAGRSAQAARQTNETIAKAVLKAEAGVTISRDVGQALDAIAEDAGHVNSLIEHIASESADQAHGIDQITSAVEQMDIVTQRIAANAEQSAAASEQLSAQAECMRDLAQELETVVEGQSMDQQPLPPGVP